MYLGKGEDWGSGSCGFGNRGKREGDIYGGVTGLGTKKGEDGQIHPRYKDPGSRPTAGGRGYHASGSGVVKIQDERQKG